MNKENLTLAQKKANKKKYLRILRKKGYNPVMQGVPWHYKIGSYNIYPTTGTYYDEFTGRKGTIDDFINLARRKNLSQKPQKNNKKLSNGNNEVKVGKKHRYCNLDKRYLPDWVCASERQERIKKWFR